MDSLSVPTSGMCAQEGWKKLHIRDNSDEDIDRFEYVSFIHHSSVSRAHPVAQFIQKLVGCYLSCLALKLSILHLSKQQAEDGMKLKNGFMKMHREAH